jgi:cytoskeletal protein CcmA (bactofilin family)
MHVPLITNFKESIFFKGELTVNEDLLIDGHLEGKIEIKDHNLLVGPNGKIKADINAKNVTVIGNVVGNIRATELVEIKAPGVVMGDIKCSRITISDGARFNGNLSTDRSANTTDSLDSLRAKAPTVHTNSSALGHPRVA